MVRRDAHHARRGVRARPGVLVDLLRGRAAGGRRAHDRGRRWTRCRATPARSAARWATPSSRPCRWRWPASSGWPPRGRAPTPAPRSRPALEGAYALGRGEARSGRSADALLVGLPGRRPGGLARARRRPRVADRPAARTRWRRSPSWSSPTSTSSPRPRVAGHADELATTGPGPPALPRPARPVGLLRGDPADAARRGRRARRLEAADDADRRAAARVAGAPGPGRWSTRAPCRRGEDAAPSSRDGLAVLLVPGRWRAGPRPAAAHASPDGAPWPARPRPWLEARASYARALRALPLRPGSDPRRHRGAPAALVLGADPAALADLRRAGPRPAGRPAAGRPRRSSPRPCAPGCCTRAAATTSRPRCSCTRRRCATGWASSASCTASGSTTPTRCWR